MSSQESESTRRGDRADEAPELDDVAAPAVSARADALDADVDAILDEIDEVLEVNAEDFVKSFVQKGGQ